MKIFQIAATWLICMAVAEGSATVALALRPVDVQLHFGKRPAGSLVKIVASIKNVSASPVRIAAVATSCGCTTAKVRSWAIKPLGLDSVAIQIDSPGGSGPFSESVLVTTAKPSLQAWRIILTGFFVTPRKNLVSAPRWIDFGNPKPMQQEKQVIIFHRNEGAKVGHLRFTASAPWIKVLTGRTAHGDREAKFTVVVTPPADIGWAHEEIRFQGRNKGDFLRLPIQLSVRPLIGVWPDSVLLMSGQSIYHLMVRPALTKDATLVSFGSKSSGIRILSVRQSKKLMDGKPALDVKAEPVGKGFISATLILRFKQWSKPVKVRFVGVGK